MTNEELAELERQLAEIDGKKKGQLTSLCLAYERLGRIVSRDRDYWIATAREAEALRAEGRVVLGEAKQPLRNGSCQHVLCWEAALVPAKVCEGGGYYSLHPTERHWAIRWWLEHKGRPGWQWPPKSADSYAGAVQEPLEARVNKIVEDERRKRGFAAILRAERNEP